MRAVLITMLVLAVVPASADDGTLARSKARYERGKELFDAGQFADAAKEFEAGYALAPRPLFLVNLGMSYRRLGASRKARAYYQQYLDMTPNDAPQRAEVESVVREIDSELGSLEPPVVVPPRRALLTDFDKPPPKKSWAARNWWIFPVGGVVLTGLAVGIYFAATPRVGAVDCGTSRWCFP